MHADSTLEDWRRIWREGFQPHLSTHALVALQRALATNDRTLVQGMTTSPADHLHNADRHVTAACALGYCGWQGEGWDTVGDVGDYFARVVEAADSRLGAVGASVEFLDWFDSQPRPVVLADLLQEVTRELGARALLRNVELEEVST